MKYLAFLLFLAVIIFWSCKTPAVSNDGEVILLYVAAGEIADCSMHESLKCFMVREKLSDDFALYFGDIEGFSQDYDYEYELKVKKISKPQAANNQPYRYEFVEEVNRVSTKEVDQRLHDIWVVTTLDGQPLKPTGPRPRLELNPTEGKVTGNGSCNEIFGTFAAAGTSIKFSRIGSTKMFCADVMEQEQLCITLLQAVDRYMLREGQLIFMQDGEMKIICQRVD